MVASDTSCGAPVCLLPEHEFDTNIDYVDALDCEVQPLDGLAIAGHAVKQRWSFISDLNFRLKWSYTFTLCFERR